MKRSLRILIVFYSIIGVIGYLCFIEDMPKLFTEREKPKGIKNDFLMDFAKVLIILIVTLKIPLNVSPCRDAIFVLMNTSTEKAKAFPFIMLTAAILLISLGLALAIPDIVSVLSILGGSFGVAHAFIFPCLMEFKLSKELGKFYTWQNLKIGLITFTMTVLGFGNVIILLVHNLS